MTRKRSAARREYDRLAAAYDRRWAAYIDITTRATLAELELAPGDRLLDVGCGTGALLGRIAPDAQGLLAGCDLSPAMLGVARQRLGVSASLVACEAQHLPFANRSFHHVVSASSLHLWPDPAQALREIARLLRPRGSLVLTDWSGDASLIRALEVWLRVTGRGPTRAPREGALAAMLERHGFTVEAARRYHAGWRWPMLTVVARRSPAQP